MRDHEVQPDDDPSRPHLFCRWRQAPDARGVVLVLHGFGEHGGRYEHVFAALNQAGHSCLGLDYRGWGRAGGRRAFIHRFDDYLDDVQWGLDECARRTPHQPVLFGHSQGGLIAACFAVARAPALRGLALSSPALRFLVPVPPWKRWAARLASRIAPTLTMPAGIDPGLLTHDVRVLLELARDPLLVQRATARWFTESLRTQARVLADAAHVTMPLLCLVAGDDHIVDVDATREFFERCEATDKTWHRYDGAYHEVLNEAAGVRQRALHDLTAWLDRLVPER